MSNQRKEAEPISYKLRYNCPNCDMPLELTCGNSIKEFPASCSSCHEVVKVTVEVKK